MRKRIDFFLYAQYNKNMDVISLAKNYKTLAIVGICKNAGKTTALNLLLRQKGLAVTSIGRDGETTDVVTNTPKPRIFVTAGTLVATAYSLLVNCTVTREILCATGISCPLGEIVIFKCLDDGFVDLAGPSISAQLILLKQKFFELGAQKILIDGALERKSFSCAKIADAVLLAVGASYDKNINKVIAETDFTLKLYSLPQATFDAPPSQNVTEDAQKGKTQIFTEGALSESTLKQLCLLKNANQLTVAVSDASKILASPKTVNAFLAKGAKLQTKNIVKVIAVTVNPYSAYGWQFDKDDFKHAIQQITKLPVLNALEDCFMSNDKKK